MKHQVTITTSNKALAFALYGLLAEAREVVTMSKPLSWVIEVKEVEFSRYIQDVADIVHIMKAEKPHILIELPE